MRSARKRIDLELVSRRLLNAGIAESAAWPTEDIVRLPGKDAEKIHMHDKWSRFVEDVDSAEKNPWRFVMRHPIITLRAIPRGATEVSENENGAGAGATARLRAALDQLRESILEQQAISAVEREIDRDLFARTGSGHWDEHVRLVLRNIYIDLALGNPSANTSRVVVEPRLLLHRSGAIQLSIALSPEGELDSVALEKLARADTAQIVRVEFGESWMKATGTSRSRWLGETTSVIDRGEPIHAIDFNEPSSVLELSEFVLSAILGATGITATEAWHCYVTSIVSTTSCCKDEAQWRSKHSAALAQLVNRYARAPETLRSPDQGQDFSVSTTSSLYLSAASATYVGWRQMSPAILDLHTTLVIEHAVLLYWRMASLQIRLGQPLMSPKKLRRNQWTAIDLLAELDQRSVRYGTARQITRHILRELGAYEMRTAIESALALQAQAFDTRQASRNSRRANGIAAFGVVIALLVSVPSVGSLLSLASATPQTLGWEWLFAPLRWLDGLGSIGAWVLVGTVLLATTTLWVLPSLVRIVQIAAAIRIRRRGPYWREPGLVYSLREDAED